MNSIGVFSCNKYPFFRSVIYHLKTVGVLAIPGFILFELLEPTQLSISVFFCWIGAFLLSVVMLLTRARYPYKIIIGTESSTVFYTWLIWEYQREISGDSFYVEYEYGKSVFRTAYYLKMRPFFKGVSFCFFTDENYWSESDLQKMIKAFEDNSVKIVR